MYFVISFLKFFLKRLGFSTMSRSEKDRKLLTLIMLIIEASGKMQELFKWLLLSVVTECTLQMQKSR